MPTTEEQDKLKERTWISEFAGSGMLRHAGKNSFGQFGQLAMPLSVRFASDTPDFCSQCQCHRDEPLDPWHPKWGTSAFASWSFLLHWCLLPVGVSIDCFTGLWFPNRS